MSFTACTIASPAYHAHARALAESFLAHHPGGRIAVLDLALADASCEPLGPVEGAETIDPRDVLEDPDDLERLGLAYTTQGLAGALKVRLLRHLLRRGDGAAMLIDADILVLGDLGDLAERAGASDALLTTHMITPEPGAEAPTLLAGVFNSGFVTIAERGLPLLDWWAARTRRQCIFRPAAGMVWEQSWLALAPAFFEVDVLRDAGVNAMTRELLSHDVEWRDERPHLAGRPLRAFHFSGPYDPRRPERLLSQVPDGPGVEHGERPGAARPVPWLSLAERPGMLRLSHAYAETLLRCGYDAERRARPPFLQLPDGPQLTIGIRCAYRDGLIAAEEEGTESPPNPFAGASTGELIAWLAEPPDAAAAAAGLSRFALGMWNAHGLATAFGDPRGADAPAYLAWLRANLERDPRSLPPRLLPAGPERRSRVRRRLGRR